MFSPDTEHQEQRFSLSSGYYTIQAGRPFAHDLAHAILKHMPGMDMLSTTHILVPSRRSVQALQAAFIQACKGQPILLPKITPIGDIDEDNSDILAAGLTADLVLPEAVSQLEKQLILSQLIQRLRIAGHAISPTQAIKLASSLGRLLDQMNQMGCLDTDKPFLLEKTVPENLAAHWLDILKFLDIIFRAWPQILAEQGRMDPVVKRLELANLQIKSWIENPPQTPVILAGSTGSLPKTVEMMRVIGQLPSGLVVFPGLPPKPFDKQDKQAIAEDTGHPLHQLFTTLEQLQLEPENIRIWPDTQPSQDKSKQQQEAYRTVFLTELFKPAPQTRSWRSIRENYPEIDGQAIDGMRYISAADMQQEADIIACLMRHALQTKDQTAMLVTPDRKLAKQVRAALLKWELDIEDSAGVSLSDTSVGEYLLLIAQWFIHAGDAHSLLALIKHPLASGGMNAAAFAVQARKLEKQVLRGYLNQSDFKGIKEVLRGSKKFKDLADFYEDHILAPLHPLTVLREQPNTDLARIADAHGQAAEQMAQSDIENAGLLRLWDRPDGKIAVQLLAELADKGTQNPIKIEDYASVFRILASEHTVRKSWRNHARLSILGTVEARMQSADLVILGGVNEGVWPPKQQADPWTNQVIREAVGLPDRRWRSGLSAHDFFMLAHHRNIVITRSARSDDAPTTPSRWIERMFAVLKAAALDKAMKTGVPEALDIALNADKALPVQPTQRPEPCPEIALRPRQFSATEFDIWIGDPYQIYARKILRLRKLDDINKKPDAALRGTLIHNILAEYLKDYLTGPLPDDAFAKLPAAAKISFSQYLSYAPVRLFWLQKFDEILKWFLEEETVRRQTLSKSYVECNGEFTIQSANGPVKITARADRIDIYNDNQLCLIDYKTGNPPSKKEVENGRATQLLVELALIEQHAFGFEIPEVALTSAKLEYWQLSGHKDREGSIQEVTPKTLETERIMENITALISAYDEADKPYLPEPDSDYRPKFSDYRHLARIREWRPQDVDND